MRLLVCTQAVDRSDPVLGFFHAWIEGLSGHAERVHVICLKEGSHALPGTARVHSLGKERGRRPAWRYALRFIVLAWQLRREYETVFVHMNEEYVLLFGILWRLSGKRVVLWRNHKMGSVRTRLACRLAHSVCYTSPSAFVASYRNAERMPIGIDTDLFAPAASPAAPGTLLFLGRLDPVKKPEAFLDAVRELEYKGVQARADVYGDATPGREQYAHDLKERYKELNSITFHSAIAHHETPAVYRSHAIYANTTPSGSFDKTIGEAMASGCVVVAGNSAVRDILGEKLFIEDLNNPVSVARALVNAVSLSEEERHSMCDAGRAWIVSRHSMRELMKKLEVILSA